MTDGEDTSFPHDDIGPHYGLTKREYFAAMAMQGIQACPLPLPKGMSAAEISCCLADALIEELNKGKL